ncbi:DUF2933 domain-containing protein [Halioglobus maricola]|jgi:DUF2933 family protein|uniref:DUF2933 domain-containing protein n=1 Tax=Halioglobus maricola TaxID=2601894 RepID=A0A5P9NM88_9GAMM|nr:DUF2933 domain-containing protein [Halioglobus maricola]
MNITENEPKQWLTTRNIAITSIGGAVLYYLWVEHHTHLIHFLPYAIFILCPFVHIFMHGGHSHVRHWNDTRVAADHEDSKAPSTGDEIDSHRAKQERNN